MTQTSVQPQPRGRIATTVAVLRVKFEKILSEAAKFGVIGLMALVIDVGLFNLLLLADSSMFASKPLTAKVISVTAATTSGTGLQHEQPARFHGRGHRHGDRAGLFVVHPLRTRF